MKKYFNKYTVAAFIIGAVLFSSIGVFADTMNVSKNPFPVFIDGIEAKVEAYNIGGYTYLKLGDLRQTGLKVVFNETDKKIEITTVAAYKEESTPAQNTTQPAASTQPTTATPSTTPVQETTPTPAPEPEPVEEPEPDLTVYYAKLEVLTEQYNQDIKKIKDEAREEAGKVSLEFSKKFPKKNGPDDVGYDINFRLMQEKIQSINKKAEEKIELRTKQYNADVAELKQEYGIK